MRGAIVDLTSKQLDQLRGKLQGLTVQVVETKIGQNRRNGAMWIESTRIAVWDHEDGSPLPEVADGAELQCFTAEAFLALFVEPEPCPSCAGSGEYIGLAVKESCQDCGGSGRRQDCIPY